MSHIALVLALLAVLSIVQAEVHPCKQHLSSCHNCLGDTENSCVLCSHSNLQQCLSSTDPLATFCGTFGGDVLQTVDQCDAEDTLSETCASFSTENNLNCTGCLATEGCGWCAISPGADGTGSCHAASGGMAQTVCSLLSGGAGVFVTDSSDAEDNCPSSAVPNYCPTYLLNCDGCAADTNCGTCLDFSNADSCQVVERCISLSNADAECRNNDMLFRGTFLPDLDGYTCANSPTNCAELDTALGITTAPTPAESTTAPAPSDDSTTASSDETNESEGSGEEDSGDDTIEVGSLESSDEGGTPATPKPSSASRLAAASIAVLAIVSVVAL